MGRQQPLQAIELHIEELILHGFASPDRAAIAEAVQRELTRLLGEGGLASWMSGDTARVVNVGSFEMTPGATPDIVGRQVAQAVYSGPPRSAGER